MQEKDRVDLLWKVYQEHYTNARHHETQRSSVIQYLLITGGLIGTLISAGGVTRGDWPLAAFLIALGLFGAIFSGSHFERYHRHKKRAGAYREHIDTITFPDELLLWQLKDTCDRERRARHPWLTWMVSVHWLWLAFPLLVSLLGVILLVMAVTATPDGPGSGSYWLADRPGR